MKINEGAREDIDASKAADTFYQYAVDNLRRKAEIDPDKTVVPMRMENIYGSLYLIFSNEVIGSGEYYQNKYGDNIISIGIGKKERSVRNALTAMQSRLGSDTFRHEAQHMFDIARHRVPNRAKYDHEKFMKGTSKEQDEVWPEYVNNPHEYNTYFHNIAEPLLRLIRIAEEEGIAAAKESCPPIDKDFRRYYQQMMWESPLVNSTIMRTLDATYRKKMLKRLYALHQAAVEIVGGTDKDGRPLVIKVVTRLRKLLRALK